MEAFVTMITPYTKEGQVDYKIAEKYVDWYFEAGLDGIFAVCQSSEIFWLSLDEKVKLNSVVYHRAKQLEKKYGRKFTVVSSGHTSDSLEEQAKELNAIWESGTDNLILITNRLDPNNEGDDVFIKNAEKLLAMLPADVKLGLYECPYPYKRLMTPKLIGWCLQTDKFYYMKDTCCDIEMMRERLKQVEGTQFKLYNANGQTLLETMKDGAEGYCGIMTNFHPKLYAWLCHEFENQPEKAEVVQAILGTFAFTESPMPYPLSAKYHMNLCGMPTENFARNRKAEELTPYVEFNMRQMKLATDYMEKELGL